MNATLACWSCRRTISIGVSSPPRFAFELAGWANDVGWIGVLDWPNNRGLVFCSQGCVEAAKKNDGSFRKRPLARLAAIASNAEEVRR